jgi:group I intron endonuclease
MSILEDSIFPEVKIGDVLKFDFISVLQYTTGLKFVKFIFKNWILWISSIVNIKIYKISNTTNTKLYIGITKRSLCTRFQQHCITKNSAIGNAIRKHGKENFIIEQIDEAFSLQEAGEKETMYINKYNSTVDGDGYNIIEVTYPQQHSLESKIRLVEGLKNSRIDVNNPYVGIYFLQERKRWSYCIKFDGKSIKQKNYETAYDAAIGRDCEIVTNFNEIVAKRLMNFPEKYDDIKNKIIIKPERIMQRELKKSEYQGVLYEKRNNRWRARFSALKISMGLFYTESDAAEAADFLAILHNIERHSLNFPEKMDLYKDPDYSPPLIISIDKSKVKHKHIGLSYGKYRINITHNGIKYRPFANSLEEAIELRNKKLIELGRKIPLF